MTLHWTITALLLFWGLLYAGLVVFTFVVSSPAHWDAFVSDGRISRAYADYIAALPTWVVALTVVAAATRLGGAIFLGLLHRWALPVYALSLACVAVIMFRGFVLAGVADVISKDQAALELVFLLMSILAVAYSWYQWRGGVLR